MEGEKESGRETNRKVGAEKRAGQRKRAAMREHLGPDQKHRLTYTVITVYLAGISRLV